MMMPQFLDAPLLKKLKPQWLTSGHKSRAGLGRKPIIADPLTHDEKVVLHRGMAESRQQRRNAAFHLAFVDISVKYPGESRKARRAMARARSKRSA